MFNRKLLFGLILLISFWGCSHDENSIASNENDSVEDGVCIENLDTAFFNRSATVSYPKLGNRWALLVAGSIGWGNYRYEADAFAMYQRLKEHGYDDDHIVLITEDDIAYNAHNKEPGVLRTSLDGENVYDSSAIDYNLSELSVADLGNILNGNKSSRLPQVIGAKPEDNIFIYWSSHGIQGELEFGTTHITYEQMVEILKETPHRKIMFAIEACYSGGMGEAGVGIPGVVYLTAADPYETSHAIEKDESLGVFLTNDFTQGLEEMIKKNPGTSLRDAYLDLACKVSDSHVHVYNMENYGRVYTERMSEFFALP